LNLALTSTMSNRGDADAGPAAATARRSEPSSPPMKSASPSAATDEMATPRRVTHGDTV